MGTALSCAEGSTCPPVATTAASICARPGKAVVQLQVRGRRGVSVSAFFIGVQEYGDGFPGGGVHVVVDVADGCRVGGPLNGVLNPEPVPQHRNPVFRGARGRMPPIRCQPTGPMSHVDRRLQSAMRP
jgi:hypothetical protein